METYKKKIFFDDCVVIHTIDKESEIIVKIEIIEI